AHLQDGSTVDYVEELPGHIYWLDQDRNSHFLNFHWGRYFIRLTDFEHLKPERIRFGAYMCRAINRQEHPFEKNAVSVDVHFASAPPNRAGTPQTGSPAPKFSDSYRCQSSAVDNHE